MNFRRYYIPGAAVFITQIVQNRQRVFQDPEMVGLLRTTMVTARRFHPFDLLAYVFLPDHFHIIIQPTGGSNFSQIMHSLKPNFTKAYKTRIDRIDPLKFWQKRFWDHVIRDEHDLENHIHYIHYNPVKHGWVTDPCDWPESSYQEWEKRGLYPAEFTWSEPVHMIWGE
jgi:putative transposase